MLRDIPPETGATEVKRLREREAQARLIIQSARDAVVELDGEGLISGWNAQAEATFGWNRTEVMAKPMAEIVIAQQDRRAYSVALREFVTTGEAALFERRIEITALHRKGHEFPIEISTTPLKVGGQWVFSAFLRDITKRKKAQETLHESEERFRLMVASVKDYAIFMLDANGYVASWNAGARRFKGYEPHEIIGKHFSVFYSKEDVERHKPERQLKHATAAGHFEDQGWRVRKDGSRFFADVVITAFRDKSGELRGFLKVTRDITEQKKAEEASRDSATQIEEANRLKSEFLANMSHELRTPLNGIIGFSEFLIDEKAGKLAPKQKEYLSDILDSGQHLLQLINDVLDLSKVEAGKMELLPETFTIADAIEEVCVVVMSMATRKNVTICREVKIKDEVTLDKQKFKQVLFNLLSNAVKFTDEGGKVEILASLNGAQLRLQVRDSGIGIKADDISKLFVEFQQLDSGAARRYPGTGLGLALTKKIVEFQHGAITVDSELGKGSTFTVVLPRISAKVTH